MADELRRKLQFNNTWLQSQAAWKLYDNIASKKSSGVINGSSVEPPELKILWEMCGDQSESLSRICCQCLTQLVCDGHADCDYIINGLLNCLPSAGNVSGNLQALSSLLLLQIQASTRKGEGYKCPFSLRSPPHPFITVLTNCHDAAAKTVIEQIKLLLRTSNTTSSLKPREVVRMLEPVFKFVLLDPKNTISQLTQLQLHSALLQTAHSLLKWPGKSNDNQKLLVELLLNFLMSLIPCYQVDAKSLELTTSLIHDVTYWLLDHFEQLDCGISHLQALKDHLLSLCCECLHHGRDMMSSLMLLQTVHSHQPQIFVDSHAIPTLSELLLTCPEYYHQQITELCLSVLHGQTHCSGSDIVTVQASHLLLMVPILQILTSPAREIPSVCSLNNRTVRDTALQILTYIEHHLLPLMKQEIHPDVCMSEQNTDMHPRPHSLLSQQLRKVIFTSKTFLRQIHDQNKALLWLQQLQTSSPKRLPSHVTLMLGALLTMSDNRVTMEILKVFPLVAKVDPSQAPYFLPLLLYKLGKEPNPEIRQRLLYTVPELATHKFCIGHVLRTVQTIGKSPALRPLSLRLLCKLWELQSRIFPHLQRALNATESNLPADLYMELQVAKAATILDICSLRPSQHGGDLLGLLSSLLDENCQPGKSGNVLSALVVSLALQALQRLCQAEVVDICTAWDVLSAKLSLDRRPRVLVSLCQLFSTVPSLATNSSAYEEFKDRVLIMLWSFAQHKEPLVASAAFSALSMFDPDDFKLIYLPERIYLPLRKKALASQKRAKEVDGEDERALEESVDNMTPPGSVYIEFLQTIDQQTLPGFQKLLASIIRREAESLPRGLAHTASRANSSGDRSLQAIPGFLISEYEKSKTPGLSQGMAAGILFSFQLPIEQHRGKGARRYLVNCARRYRQILDSLLHEVPVQPSEWHRSMLMPETWSAFMTRAYWSCVEGRKAELEMQHSHGHIQDSDELKSRQENAWLWVRNQLTDQLKAASRGNPSVQGNSVQALAGLAAAVSCYLSQQTESGETHQYQRNTDWLIMVTDTLMVVLDGNYKPKGNFLVWCQQVSSSSSTASSLLARACAALSLSQLVSSLVTLDTSRIHSMTELLKQRIPGQSKAGSSAVIQTFCSLGLGLLLSKLYVEHFSDLAGKEGYLLTTTALDCLENAVFSQDLENTEGAVLGLGLALSSLCEEGIVDSRVHVISMHSKLMAFLDDWSQEPSQKLQSLCVSLASVSVNSFHAGLLSTNEVTRCIEKLQRLSEEYTQTCGVYLALGLLVHGLASCGYTAVIPLGKHLGQTWVSWFDKKDVSGLQQLSALNGIMGLLGSEQGMLMVEGTTCSEFLHVGTVIKYLQKLVSSPREIGLATNAAWLLGHLYAASTTSSARKGNVPSNYSYLPEGSTLKPLFEFLVEAGKSGPHLNFSGSVVPAALESLVRDIPVRLPPVNWVSVIGPIMRAEFGEEASQICIRLAVSQAQSSSSLSSFLSSLLSTTVFIGLRDLCKLELLRNIQRLLHVVSSSKMKEFFEGTLADPWNRELNHDLQGAIFEAHLSVLRLGDPPPSVMGWTVTCVEKIYSTCPVGTEDDLLDQLGLCLTMIPSHSLERILCDIQNVTLKAVVARCAVVRESKVPLKWLSPCINWILQADLTESEKRVMVNCVVSAIICSDDKRKEDDRQQWFLEVIGQCKSVLSSSPCSKTLQNCFTVLSLLSTAWSNECLYQDIRSSDIAHAVEPGISSEPRDGKTDETLSWLLPLTLSTLLERDSWTLITGKVLDWLLSVRDWPAIQFPEEQRMLVQDIILSLRQTVAFKKSSVWTDVAAHLVTS